MTAEHKDYCHGVPCCCLGERMRGPTRQRHVDKIRAILGHHHASSCKTSAFDRDNGPCDCGAELKARQIVEYFERVASDG